MYIESDSAIHFFSDRFLGVRDHESMTIEFPTKYDYAFKK